MRIVNLAECNVWDLGYGKGRASTYRPLKGLVERGHEVWWLTSAEQVDAEDDVRLKHDGIEVVRFHVPVPGGRRDLLSKLRPRLFAWMFLVTCFARGYALARHIRADLLYANQLIAAFPAFFLSRALRVPYVVRTYGPHRAQNFAKRLYGGKLAFRLPADLYILVNDGTSGESIALSCGVPKEKVAFLVNGIDKSLPTAHPSLRKKLAPNGEGIVVSAYRLVPFKQVDLLIKAIPQIVSHDSNVVFVIIGDGHQRAELEHLCEDLGVSQFVRFEGATPNSLVPRYMAAADVVVSLNAESSITNPVLEAMCVGKPVIALNAGTTSELIRHLHNGVLVEPEQVAMLPTVILQLLHDEHLRRRLGKEARTFILENWPSWDDRVALEVQLLEQLVRHHAEPVTPRSPASTRR